ncbi:MAG: aldehyde dehydrogenase family protein, partial [Rhodospirillales bacterium]|nr:aldehyde dehydrogenase family protein [Rhodospirillales bacterium]
MNDFSSKPTAVRHESMRIAGKKVDSERTFEIFNPYTGEVVGTAPRATSEQIREAFQIAADYEPALTRYDRQQILFRAAEILESRKDEISDVITAECGICKKDSLYEVGRAYDVFTLSAQLAIIDDGESYSCDITPQGKARRIFTTRDPLTAISAITPFNHPLNMPSHKV